MLSARSAETIASFAFFNGDAGAAIGIATVGLVITGGAIAGIVALARSYSRGTDTGKVMTILGILFLLGFVLIGLLATGCGAMLAG